MRRLLSPLFVLILTAACGGGDNASPQTHGAHNKPSQGGETRSGAAPQSNPDSAPQNPGAEGTYGESGATPGGAQKTTT